MTQRKVRSITVRVRCTPEEMAILRREAEKLGLSATGLLRMTVLRTSSGDTPPQQDNEVAPRVGMRIVDRSYRVLKRRGTVVKIEPPRSTVRVWVAWDEDAADSFRQPQTVISARNLHRNMNAKRGFAIID